MRTTSNLGTWSCTLFSRLLVKAFSHNRMVSPPRGHHAGRGPTQTDHGERPWGKWRETGPASPQPPLSSAVLAPAVICNHRKIMSDKLGVESSPNLSDTESVGGNKMIIILITIITCVSHLVMSNSLQPHGLQPVWLLSPRNSPGKNTGVGSHGNKWLLLLHGVIFKPVLDDKSVPGNWVLP